MGQNSASTSLQPDDIVGFLEPTAQLIVEIGAGLDPDVVPAPSRPVADLLDDPGTADASRRTSPARVTPGPTTSARRPPPRASTASPTPRAGPEGKLQPTPQA